MCENYQMQCNWDNNNNLNSLREPLPNTSLKIFVNFLTRFRYTGNKLIIEILKEMLELPTGRGWPNPNPESRARF